jgi:CHAT domain-containing protein/tetratricopeptide (TPR) repeat protein
MQAGDLGYRSRYAEADSVLLIMRREARQLHMRDAEAEALITLAQMRARTQGVQPARELLRQAKPLISPTNYAVLATRSCAEASIAMRQGDPATLTIAREGRAFARRAGSRRLQGGCELALAQESERRGNLPAAIAWFDQAAASLEAVGDHHMLAAALQLGAWDRYQRGDLSLARRDYGRALAEAKRAGNPAVEAWSHLGLAYVASSIGDAVTGTAEATRAGAQMREQNDRWGLAAAKLIEAELADAADDRPNARRAYLDAIQMQRAIGNQALTIGANRQLALLAQRDGNWEEADRYLAEATRIARLTNDAGWQSELPFHRGVTALGRKEYAVAESLFASVVARQDEGGNASIYRDIRYEVRARLAEVQALRGNYDEAERSFATAANELEAWRTQLSDRDVRLAVAQARGAWGTVGQGIPSLLSTLAQNGRVSSAFAIAEARRARELVDNALRRDLLRDTTTSMSRRLKGSRVTLTLGAVQNALDSRTALVEYVAGRRETPSTAFVVTHDTAIAVTMPSLDSLGPSIERFVTLLSSGTDPRGLGASLGSVLVGPLTSALSSTIDHLVIVPDGGLYRVPFDALRLSDGRYLVERATVSIAPSATVAIALARRAPNPQARTVVAFGDPEFAGERSGDGARDAVRDEVVDSGGLDRLRYSGREARRVSEYAYRPLLRLRGEASESYLKRTVWRDVAVVHFATHALVDDRVLARSVIALAPGDREDGFLDPSELSALRIGAELVVLSGCRTAGGVVLVGEGLQGLTAPLLEAGARSVVASNWAIGDRSTLPFIDRLYAAIARGMTVGDALRQAKLDAIRDKVRIDQWSAFTLVGDAGAKPQLRARGFKPVDRYWDAGRRSR